ncbi:MAG: glycosyltransferase [Bacteroidales bacterium]|nr:glycosyltransferase [Bacteroidales bacterium]
MQLSLITVAFNACVSLEETIRSVQQQHYSNLEYIVVDGGSTDGTLEMVKKYPEVLSSFVSEPDKGIYDAMNKGLKRAKGDVVGFLHADDRFAHPQVLQDIMAVFEKKPIDALYGDLQYVTSFEPLNVLRHWKSGVYSPHLIKQGWMPPHPTVYFKRALLHQIGYFNTSFKIAADYDWLLRLLVSDNLTIDYLPKVLVHMATGGASNKSLRNIIQKSREDYRAICHNRVGGLSTLVLKNLSKVLQFLSHK